MSDGLKQRCIGQTLSAFDRCRRHALRGELYCSSHKPSVWVIEMGIKGRSWLKPVILAHPRFASEAEARNWLEDHAARVFADMRAKGLRPKSLSPRRVK